MFGMIRKNEKATRLGATISESLIAMSFLYVVFGLYVQCFTTGRNTGRVETRIQRCHDARTAFFNLTDELQKAKSISEPAIFAAGSTLRFINEKHEVITYSLRESEKGMELVRRAELSGEEMVMARNVLRVSFYRGGRSMVSCSMKFAGAGREEASGTFRTMVTLRNGIY